MSKVGIGLIGCGNRLRGIVKQLLQLSPELEVFAVYDPNDAAAQMSKDMFNQEAKVCSDYHEVLSDTRVSWVMIGSWNCFHAEHVIASFNAGKHVFCEKPLALNIEDCLAMREAHKNANRSLTIGFTLRYSPHYRRIKEIIDSGEIGKIISMEFNETLDFNHGGYIHSDWRRKTEWAGSHMLEKCCHDVDLANWMVNSAVVKAASFGGCDFFIPENAFHMDRIGNNADGVGSFRIWQSRRSRFFEIPGNVMNPFNDDKDILDNQVAILQFANGVRATFHANCMTSLPERRMYICGTEGTLRAGVIAGEIVTKRFGFNVELKDHSTDASGGHGGGDEILCTEIMRSMLHGDLPKSSLEAGLRSAITVFGIDKAQLSGQVEDLSPMWRQANIKIE